MYGAVANASGDDREVTFKTTSTKLYVPIVTLSTKDSVNLTKQLNQGFEGYVYWNENKSKVEAKTADKKFFKRFPLDAFFQGVNRLFVLAFNSTTENDAEVPASNTANRVQRDCHRKYFFPRVDTTDYNILTDGRNFYDQPVNDKIRQYDETRKIATGKGDDYTTGCLLDCKYFKDHCKLIAVDLSKQRELDADPRSIQQIEFEGMLKTNSQVCTVLEKGKETILELYKGTAKVLLECING